jgi:hypothetical protein
MAAWELNRSVGFSNMEVVVEMFNVTAMFMGFASYFPSPRYLPTRRRSFNCLFSAGLIDCGVPNTFAPTFSVPFTIFPEHPENALPAV